MNLTNDLLLTRLAVLSLSSIAGWLPSVSTDEVEMLAYVLPKTAPVATIQLGVNIACHKHDQAVGDGKYHLFRLAIPLEERISRALNEHQRSGNLPNATVDQSVAYLTKLTEGVAIDPQKGPVQAGLYTELAHNPMDMLTCLAKHYLIAYQNGYQTFPYFS
ncbi:MAG: BrxE family protein [Rudanella sp.]|nr:BrxE family protein [Rudanella sp.]